MADIHDSCKWLSKIHFPKNTPERRPQEYTCKEQDISWHFPLYPQIWKPLKDKGIKILFWGDGNMDEFTDDLVKCGVDGFHFRRETNLKRLAEKYGKDKIIVGNISTQVLTFKGREEIENEVKRCVAEAGRCPGYFLNVAGEIPYNVPTENIEFLFEAIKKYGRR